MVVDEGSAYTYSHETVAFWVKELPDEQCSGFSPIVGVGGCSFELYTPRACEQLSATYFGDSLLMEAREPCYSTNFISMPARVKA